MIRQGGGGWLMIRQGGGGGLVIRQGGGGGLVIRQGKSVHFCLLIFYCSTLVKCTPSQVLHTLSYKSCDSLIIHEAK